MKLTTLFLKKTAFTFLTIAAGFGVLGTQESQGQVNTGQKESLVEITETAYGNIAINSSQGGGIAGADITFKAIYLPGDSMPPNYDFEADATGKLFYEDVLIFHDTGVGINNNYLNLEIAEVRPNPANDFTINHIMKNKPTSKIMVTDMNGKLIGEFQYDNYVNNIASVHIDLSDKEDGIYTLGYVDKENTFSNKLVKTGNHYKGYLGIQIPKPNTKQTSREHEAIYELTISAQGYDTLVVDDTFIPDDNGWKAYTLQVEATVPQYQRLQGIAKDGDNNNAPLENITAIFFNETQNTTQTLTTGSDGLYTSDPFDVGDQVYISVGGDNSKYSFSDVPVLIPLEILNWDDTLNVHASSVLYDKMPGVETNHMVVSIRNGTREGTRKYFYGSSVSQSAIDFYEDKFDQMEIDEPDGYQYVRTMNLAEAHIVIEDGTHNTNHDSELFVTPLGEEFYPVFYAYTTTHPSTYIIFVHEIKQANGLHQVGHESVLNTPAVVYTLEDKKIGQFEKKYWVEHFYNNGDTYFGLEYIADDLTSKSPAFKSNNQ